MVNCGLAARAEKAAENKDKQKKSRHLHNCGLSFLAIRRPPSYLNQLSWQVNFSAFSNLFRKSLVDECLQSHWRNPASEYLFFPLARRVACIDFAYSCACLLSS